MTSLTSKKSAPFNETKESVRLIARTNLYRLSKDILGYTDMTDTFHRDLLLWSQTQPTKKKLALAARGTFKSTGLTIAKRIQYLVNFPANCSLIGSNKGDNAQAFLKEITGHLQNNELLMWAFPEILWTNPREQGEHYLKGSLTIRRPKGSRPRKESSIETTGVEAELVSKHFEHGSFDDVVAKENSQTRPERMKVISWYEAAQALIDQPTPELATQDITNTPWDWDDLIAYLLKKKQRGEIDLAVYFMPCWVPDPKGVDEARAHRDLADAEIKAAKLGAKPEEIEYAEKLRALLPVTFGEVPGRGRVRATFPEKLSIPTLLKHRKAMPMHFAAQYELTPADQDDAVLKRIPADDKHPYGIPVVKPRREAPPIQSLWLAITIDPAISVKGWADYSALTVCGWDHENTQHVLWLKWGKWSETQLIEETYLAFNHFAARGNAPTVVGFEAVAFQRLYLHLFRSAGEKRGHFLPITKLERDTKNTKQTRQLVLEPGWNAGEIVLYDDLDALDDLLDMAAKFRPHKELTRDDLLDVLADNHQLRIRPNAPQTLQDRALAEMEPHEQQMVRYMVETQARRKEQGAGELDDSSLRMAWLNHKRQHEHKEAEYADSLGLVEDAILWG